MLYQKSPRTAVYIREQIAEKLGFDINKGKMSLARERKLQSGPAIIDGKDLYLDRYSLAGVTKNITEGSENFKMLPRRIDLKRLFSRNEKTKNLTYGKEIAKGNEFFDKTNRNVFENIRTEMGVGKQENLNISLTKFPQYLAVRQDATYEKPTYKYFKLVRVWTDPDTSATMTKKNVKGYNNFFNIEQDDFLDNAYLGTAAQYVEVELMFSNSQTNIAGLLPGEKTFKDIQEEIKEKQEKWNEQEEETFDEEEYYEFETDEVISNNNSTLETETEEEETEFDEEEYADEDVAVEVDEDNNLTDEADNKIYRWEEDSKNKKIIDFLEERIGTRDIVAYYKSMRTKRFLTIDDFLEDLERAYKCR